MVVVKWVSLARLSTTKDKLKSGMKINDIQESAISVGGRRIGGDPCRGLVPEFSETRRSFEAASRPKVRVGADPEAAMMHCTVYPPLLLPRGPERK